MTLDEIKNIINTRFVEKYDINMSTFGDSFKLTDLENLNPKLDSMELAEFLFDTEDTLGLRVEEGDIPTTLGEFYGVFFRAANREKDPQ